MDATQNAVQSPDSSQAATAKKKRVIPKLSYEELMSLPGAKIAQPTVQKGDSYYIVYCLPVTESLGSADEISQAYVFSDVLNREAKGKELGEVISVGVSKGTVEVVVKLLVTEKPESDAAPAANFIRQLDGFLSNATQLRPGIAGKSVSYKLKVNGTTIADVPL